LSAAFDLIKQQIAEFDDDTAAAQAAEKPSACSATSDEMPADVIEVEIVQAVIPTENDAATEAADVANEAAEMAVEALNVTPEVTELTAEAADAHDEAVLDLVALEMAAPQPADSDDPADTGADTGEAHVAGLAPADSKIAEPKHEPAPAPAQPPAVQPSLGSTLIANGIVRRPNASPADPLAPIRRMSQAERIALFS
jgi:hypothetical protein